jgi:hypothetical protein
MTSERDTTRIVRSWLEEGVTVLPDRVLDTVLDQLPATPQRRAWWPVWRIAEMNTFAKFAIVAVAVVAVAVVGYSLLPASGGLGVGGPGASASPSASPSPSPSPSLSPSPSAALDFPPAGDLATGQRHAIVLGGVPFTFTVPTTGWVSNGEFGIDKAAGVGPDGAGFILWTDTPVGVFTDPCAHTMGPDLGASVADLAVAVAAVPGTDLVDGPTDVTVGGKPAKQVALTIRDDIGCAPDSFYLWYAPGPGNARYATAVGSTIRTWIIDVDGTPVWIDAETYAGAKPEPGQEVQQIIDSIEFD